VFENLSCSHRLMLCLLANVVDPILDAFHGDLAPCDFLAEAILSYE
jgi:hypothetical protein